MTAAGPPIVGWLPRIAIPVALPIVAELLPNHRVSLVSAIDSSRNVAELPSVSRFSAGHPGVRPLGRGMLVDREHLAAMSPFFTGFDEIWFFATAPSVPLPAEIRLTSEAPAEPDPRLDAWFAQSGCALGLGDGIGLNYATPDARLARLLVTRCAAEGGVASTTGEADVGEAER